MRFESSGAFGRRRAFGGFPRRQLGRAPFWLILGVGLLGGVGLYWYTTPQAVPAWARKWLPLPGLPDYTGPLYRWRDDQGREQITDKPPRNRPYETMRYRSNANVLPPNQ
ncbi:MAG: hypothetical protein WBE39_18520 [Candidatus Competibacter sp.]